MSTALASSLGERITAARAAHELNAIADEVTCGVLTSAISDDELDHLRVAYSRRCRELWPGIVR